MRDRYLNAGLAFFALGTFAIYYLAIPLWASSLDASPFMIGLAVGIRPLLPALLSIHGGALMDRLSVRQVLLVTGTIGVITPILIPLFPDIYMLIALQLVGGLSEGLGWLGAQTRLAQVSHGDTKAAGWFTMAGKIGMTVSPLVAGLVWDRVSPFACFMVIAIWAGGFLLTVLALPHLNTVKREAVRVRALLPRLSDYRNALILLAIPMVALVCLTTFVRLATFGVQASFYPVFLEGAGISGTLIGSLISFASLVAVPSALAAAPLAQRFGEARVTLWVLLFAVVGITAPPFFPGTFGLFVLAAMFGIGNGVTLPLMLSLLSKATPRERQGVAAGLRATVNRLGNLVIPIVMGTLVQLFGMKPGFVVIGVMLVLAVFILMLFVRRTMPDANP